MLQKRGAARLEKEREMAMRKAKATKGAEPEEQQPLACILLGSLSGVHEFTVAMVDTGCSTYQVADFYNHLRSVLKGFGLEQKTAPLRRRCSSAATAATQHSHAFGCSQQTTYSHAFGCSPFFSCSCIRSCLSQIQTSQ